MNCCSSIIISFDFVYRDFIITILNNLLRLEDYFQKKLIQSEESQMTAEHRFVGLVRYSRILVTLDTQSAL